MTAKNLSNRALAMWNGALPVDTLVIHAMNRLVDSIQELIAVRTGSHLDVSYTAAALRDYYGSMALLQWNGNPVQPFDPLSTFYPTCDGFIRIHANYPHHRMKLFAALGLSTDLLENDPLEIKLCVAQEIAGQSSLDLERMIIEEGGIAGAVRTPAEYVDYMEDHPLIEQVEYPVRESQHMRSHTANILPERPLSGVKVLNLTRVIAGPSAGKLLAALGAEVLRIDPPEIPEILAQHLDMNPGVRSAIADYTISAKLHCVHELLSQADAVLLGYRPGALTRFGLDPASLTEKYPHLSIASLSAWHQRETSIFSRGFDSIVQAVTGIASIYSHAGKPGALPVQALDMTTGLCLVHQVIHDIARQERSTRHYTLEGFSLALQDLAADVSPIREPESAIDPRVADMSRRESEYGILDYVPPPLWIGHRRLDYASPVQKYGSAQLQWSE